MPDLLQQLRDLEAERDRLRQTVADLRLISNVNGDWTASSSNLHLRAGVLEGALRATVEALVKWNGVGDDERSLVIAAVIRNARKVLDGDLSLADEMAILRCRT